MTYHLDHKTIFVAGHTGLVGRAVRKRLSSEPCTVLTITRDGLDLSDQAAVNNWFKNNRPDAVILCAARVGGIHANASMPAQFIYDNLMIEANIIHAAYKHAVEKLLFLGSSCIYPRDCPQPIREEYLMTGPLEPTNEPYAVAKIAGIKMCQAYRRQYGCDFISAMPTNLYGPNDNFHGNNGHVPAAFIKRFHEATMTRAQSVEIWGTGETRREFLHCDDLADALVFLLRNYSDNTPVNIGTGDDIKIMDFARLVADITGFKGTITCDMSRPDGTMRKCLDVTKINNLGWHAITPLEQGIKNTYEWYKANLDHLRAA